MPTDRPTLDELRAVTQPASTMNRRNAEHWLARWFLREVSLRVTRLLIRTPVTRQPADRLMIVVGLVAAVAARPVRAGSGPSSASSRSRSTSCSTCATARSPAGAGRPASPGSTWTGSATTSSRPPCSSAYGFRAGGQSSAAGPPSAWPPACSWCWSRPRPTWWTSPGRARVPRRPPRRRSSCAAPAWAAARRAAQVLKVHQLTGALEVSFLLLVAAVVDAATGTLHGTQVLPSLFAVIAAVRSCCTW